MIHFLKILYTRIDYIYVNIFTCIVCLYLGLKYDKTWKFIGRPIILRPYIFHRTRKNALKIGKNITLVSKFEKNSIGLIQPVYLNVRNKTSQLLIGDNVGISGSTISVAKFIKIGNNVLIGSGCLITDNDAHNINYLERDKKLFDESIKPVYIEDNVFIGARSIILKGVIVGEGSVIGAGSVVTKNVPKNVIVAGNPAKIIKHL